MYHPTKQHPVKTVPKTDGDDGNISTNPTVRRSLDCLGDVLVAVVGSGATRGHHRHGPARNLDVDDGSYGDGAQYLIKSDSSDTAMVGHSALPMTGRSSKLPLRKYPH